jgi:type I restriction enzyme S subunit
MNDKWNLTPLSKCISKVIDYRGRTPKKLGLEWASVGYRVLSANNVKFSGLDKLDSINYADEDLYKKWMKEEVNRGDLLLTSEAPSGQVMLWDSDEKIVLSQRLYALRVNSKIDAAFLKYYLQSPVGQKEIFRNNSGSTVAGISAKTFDNILIRHPRKKDVQEKIGHVLYSIDKKIDCNNRINAELETMAKTLYDYWFVQFDFPDANGKPYQSSGGKMDYNPTLKREIPAGWKDSNILAVADLLGGGTPTKKKPEYWSGDIPFFTPTDADGTIFKFSTADSITEEGLKGSSTKLFGKHTIFITARGSVGKLVLAGVDMAMNQSCYALRAKPDVSHIFLFFLAKELIHHLQVKSSGSVFDSIVSNDIELTWLAIPQSQVIEKFAAVVEPAFEKIANNTKENQHLAQLRDWLLPMLMNGQVTVA